jgi:hypothetical protein
MPRIAHIATIARRAAAALLVAAAFTAPAAARQEEAETAPQPGRNLTLQTPVIGYAIMALAAAGLVGVSLMRSKRGAQD